MFVGRWSMQKGIDLIADVFPSVLETYPKVQLITVGPVIDLYGRFAALKLSKMMELYPGRVYSKPVYTALPPYIFSGSEFALIPSRDEPFGLVAVEFGRKGALGVGARVGGLGNMPGWWYTVESMTPKHLVQQFKMAIHDALASSLTTRSMMRARSAKQRFPVAQWVENLDTLVSTSIKISEEENFEKIPSFGGNEISPSMTSLRTLFTGGQGNSSQVSLGANSRKVSQNSLPLPGTSGTPWSPTPGTSWSPTPSTSWSSAPGIPWSPTPGTPWTPTPREISNHWTPMAPSLPRPRSPSPVSTPGADELLIPRPNFIFDSESLNRRFAILSYDSVAGGRDDFRAAESGTLVSLMLLVHTSKHLRKSWRVWILNRRKDCCVSRRIWSRARRASSRNIGMPRWALRHQF